MSLLEGFRFADPAWLWAGLLGPLVLVAALLRERHGRAIVFPGLARLGRGGTGGRTRLRHVPIALAALGLVLGAVALARPQWGSVKRDVTNGATLLSGSDKTQMSAPGDGV